MHIFKISTKFIYILLKFVKLIIKTIIEYVLSRGQLDCYFIFIILGNMIECPTCSFVRKFYFEQFYTSYRNYWRTWPTMHGFVWSILNSDNTIVIWPLFQTVWTNIFIILVQCSNQPNYSVQLLSINHGFISHNVLSDASRRYMGSKIYGIDGFFYIIKKPTTINSIERDAQDLDIYPRILVNS